MKRRLGCMSGVGVPASTQYWRPFGENRPARGRSVTERPAHAIGVRGLRGWDTARVEAARPTPHARKDSVPNGPGVSAMDQAQPQGPPGALPQLAGHVVLGELRSLVGVGGVPAAADAAPGAGRELVGAVVAVSGVDAVVAWTRTGARDAVSSRWPALALATSRSFFLPSL